MQSSDVRLDCIIVSTAAEAKPIGVPPGPKASLSETFLTVPSPLPLHALEILDRMPDGGQGLRAGLRDEKQPSGIMRKTRKFYIFGNFGTKNFGNEATLQAILYNLHRLAPDADITCVCTFPASASATHGIPALPISPPVITAWTPMNRVERVLRAIFFGIPSELYRWWDAFTTLKGVDALIIPGTGLLTDAFGLSSWGPYGVFRWSLLAKLRRCNLFFVSVGAGPLAGPLGRRLVKAALGFANFRSYRDASSLECLREIGFISPDDRVYPDLAFSLPRIDAPHDREESARRPVVGIGLMKFNGMYGATPVSRAAYQSYLDCLAVLVQWLLDRGYGVKLLIGELGDPVSEFRHLLSQRLPSHDSDRVLCASRVTSVDDLLSQISDAELVVATRFHNVLFSLLNNKPTVSISFHDKCTSLMSAMGLSEYCLRIDQLTPGDLIAKILDIERNSGRLKSLIAQKCDESRDALEKQYKAILATQARSSGAAPT